MPGVAIAGGSRDGDRGRAHPLPQRWRDRRRRRLLDHLLMPALNRALALEEVHDVAVCVGQDLELDVARAVDQPLDVQGAVAKGRERFAPRLRDRGQQLRLAAHGLHPDAAAAF